MDRALTLWETARRVLPFKHVSEQEVYDRIRDETAHLWVNGRSAGVTEVTDNGFLHLWLAGGTLCDLLPMFGSCDAFGQAMGCNGLEVSGRRGWLRVLRKFGFVKDGDRMVKIYG